MGGEKYYGPSLLVRVRQATREHWEHKMALRLGRFLNELLDVLREDYPEQLSRLIKDANGLTYLQVLDKETAVITVRNRRITIASRRGRTR